MTRNANRRRPVPSRRRCSFLPQALEPRRLFAAPPAELVAALPSEDASINMRFEDVADVNGRLFATAWRDNTPEALYVADGAGGVAKLFDSVTFPGQPGIGITALTPFHGRLYFFGNGPTGDGLYVSDGTRSGTRFVKQFRVNSANVLPTRAFVINDKLYFFWVNLNEPMRLWRSDGTAAGTTSVLTLPADTYATGVSPVIDGTHVLFTTNGSPSTNATGRLYRTDGTVAGTVPVWDLPEYGDVPKYYTPVGDKLYFVDAGFSSRGLYVANLDGTNVRPVNVPSLGDGEVFVEDAPPVPVGEKVLFQAPIPSSHNPRLFATDGTDAGTVEIAGRQVDLYANGLSQPLAVAGNKAVFMQTSVDPADKGLFVTDGTREGTRRIAAPQQRGELGGIDPNATAWFSSGGKAFLLAANDPIGIRVYESDGTTEGTRPIQYLAPGYVFAPQYLMTFGTRPLIEVSTYQKGYPQIWAIDPDVATGAMLGKGYFDNNRNNTREGFEQYFPGFAYVDVNDNGKPDTGELTREAADQNRFVLDGLPVGHYVVRFKGYGGFEGLPIDSPAGGAYRIDLQPGQVLPYVDFGTRTQATGPFISGVVFNDADADGARDADEVGQPGQQVYLDLNNDGTYSSFDPIVTTTADGTYGFAPPGPGTYTVRRKYAPGFRQTTPQDRDGVSVTVAAGQAVQAAPIGVTPTAGGTIVGAVFDDQNNNGQHDGGDTQRYDALVYLDLNENGQVDRPEEPTATTNRAGLFTFENVVPGEYVVRFDPNYVSQQGGGTPRQTSPAGGRGLSVAVQGGTTAVAGEFLVYDQFAPRPGGAISGSVFSDRDGDGVRDADEFGIPGRTVWVDADHDEQLDINERRATTDADGNYAFPNTALGTYTLRQVLPSQGGWTQTAPAAGYGRDVTLTAAQPQAGGLDFGARSTETTPPRVSLPAYVNPGAGAGEAMVGGPGAALVFTFNEDLGATFDVSDLVVTNQATGQAVPASAMRATYVTPAPSAVLTFPGLPGAALPAGTYRAVLKAGSVSDAAGNPLAEDYVFAFTANSAVTGRHVFYNNAAADGNDPAATPADDAAIAPDKRAWVRGGGVSAATFANVTSFVRGLNGIMVDLAGLPDGRTLSADDFAFRLLSDSGGTGTAAWADAPSPTSVSVRRGAGVRGDRVTIVWPDGALRNAWLEVKVLATPDTGLASPDVFYFGNLVGDTGDSDSEFRVNALDLAAVRRALSTRAGADSRLDFNRDGRVNAFDLSAARANQGRQLPLSVPPAVAVMAPALPNRIADDVLA